jgi:sulfite reductase beta subunit-like hemoprotein
MSRLQPRVDVLLSLPLPALRRLVGTQLPATRARLLREARRRIVLERWDDERFEAEIERVEGMS